MAIYYVATNGNDGWSGTLSSPNVGNTNGPWLTLQHAANSVGPGDTVRILPGTYTSGFQMTIDGTSDSPITFIADSGLGTVVIDGQNTHRCIFIGHENNNFQPDKGDWIVLDSLEVKGSSDNGITVRHSANVTIQNCDVHDNSIIYDSQNGSNGIYIQDGHDCIVQDCHLHDNADMGILVTEDQGALPGKSSNVSTLRCLVHSNIGIPENSDGIDYYRVQGAEIAYNIVYRNGDDCIDCNRNSTNMNIHHNIVFNSNQINDPNGDGNGIKVDTSSDVGDGPSGGHIVHHNISFCTNYHAYDHDMNVDQPGNFIYNNTFVGCGNAGISLDGGGRATNPISANTVKNNITAYNSGWGSAAYVGAAEIGFGYDYYASAGYTIAESDYNFIGGQGIVFQNGFVTEGSHSIVGSQASPLDPLFVNPYMIELATGKIKNTNGELDITWQGSIAATIANIRNQVESAFALQPSSPCINAGVVISGITDGFLGAAPDMGALESTPSSGGSVVSRRTGSSRAGSRGVN